VYSLNVPLPSSVGSLAHDLGRRLGATSVRQRGDHTLVAKRLGRGDAARYHELEARARDALADQPPFAVRIAGTDAFLEAESGESPVVYLAVESPGLAALHRRLCEVFDPVEGIEGEDYVPHVTVARGVDPERIADLPERPYEPIEWTVSELSFWDAEHSQSVSTVQLRG